VDVCVLGGSGFVGTELVIRLALAGHWVRVPTRNLTRAERLRVLETVELRVANVHEPRILSQLFAGCDAVINLIGILNPRGRASFEAVHTELAAKVLAGAGANVVLAASKVEELKKVAAECEALGGETEIVAKRPSSEANCNTIVAAAVATPKELVEQASHYAGQ